MKPEREAEIREAVLSHRERGTCQNLMPEDCRWCKDDEASNAVVRDLLVAVSLLRQALQEAERQRDLHKHHEAEWHERWQIAFAEAEKLSPFAWETLQSNLRGLRTQVKGLQCVDCSNPSECGLTLMPYCRTAVALLAATPVDKAHLGSCRIHYSEMTCTCETSIFSEAASPADLDAFYGGWKSRAEAAEAEVSSLRQALQEAEREKETAMDEVHRLAHDRDKWRTKHGEALERMVAAEDERVTVTASSLAAAREALREIDDLCCGLGFLAKHRQTTMNARLDEIVAVARAALAALPPEETT